MTPLLANRRRVLHWALGALAVGLAPGVLAAQPQATDKPKAGNRRMIIRADDVGFTNVCNLGAFEAIRNGVVTSADVMLDCPGTEDALMRLRDLPWISVGWHMHMWGSPVTAPAEVPSLVEASGPFKGRFRTDLHAAEDISVAEATRELRAQLARCQRVLGRLPDTAGSSDPVSPWERAVRTVLDESRLPYNFMARAPADAKSVQKIADAQRAGAEWAKAYPKVFSGWRDADPKWVARKIVSLAPTTAYADLYTDSISEIEEKYDPVLYYTEDRAGILGYPGDTITEQSWHPGWVDYFVYRTGERAHRARARQFVVSRAQDVASLCDERLKAWVREHRIELISCRDALNGTGDYQAHLRAVGSDLAVPAAAERS
jgi:predicted glycoside hydrolase/deacetylase ChbG (UPF0249 family)